MRAALLLLLLLAGPAVAQQPLPADGSELFRGLLHRLGYTPVADDTQARLVVVYGPPTAPWYAGVLRRQLESGGAVLVVAGSFPSLGESFPERWSVTLGRRQPPPEAVGQLQFPLERPVGLLGPPPNGGIPELAVPDNLVIESPTPDLRWVGDRPAWVRPVAINRLKGPFGVGLVGPPLAVGGVRPAGGRILVVGSDAVFSNLFLAGQLADDTDTGNLDFVVSALRWLKPAGDEPVPCLFLDRGRPVTDFRSVDFTSAAVGELPPVGPPPLSAFLTPEAQGKLTDAANEAFDRVQQNDRLNSPFAGRRFGRAMQWLLGVLALLAAVALVRRARAARVPKAEPPAKTVTGAGGAFARRREEQLRGGDHTAAVREYLIDLFHLHGLPLDQFRHPKRMPRVDADPTTKQQLTKLWQAAYGPHPVSYTRWKELEPMIEAVRAAGAAGKWRFAGGRA